MGCVVFCSGTHILCEHTILSSWRRYTSWLEKLDAACGSARVQQSCHFLPQIIHFLQAKHFKQDCRLIGCDSDDPSKQFLLCGSDGLLQETCVRLWAPVTRLILERVCVEFSVFPTPAVLWEGARLVCGTLGTCDRWHAITELHPYLYL